MCVSLILNMQIVIWACDKKQFSQERLLGVLNQTDYVGL